MHNSVSQLNRAEISFDFTNYSSPLKLTNNFAAGDVFVQLWDQECELKTPKRYVLFLDDERQLITWKQLPLKLSHEYCARIIAGLAIACNAKNIFMSDLRLSIATPNQRDKNLTAKTFEICEQHHIEILDYLIITPTDFVSYKLWMVSCYD